MVAETRAKKQRVSPPPANLAALPAVAIDSIFSFALEPEELNPNRWYRVAPPPDHFLAVATVSSDWLSGIDHVASARALDTIELASSHGRGRKALVAFRNQLIMRRPHLRTIIIEKSFRRKVYSSVFSHAPRLECIDLRSISKHNERILEEIVQATARFCPRLQSFQFPDYGWDKDDLCPAKDMATSITSALQSWHDTSPGGGGGLRHLRLPMFVFDRSRRGPSRTNEFIPAVASFCPRIEVLEGHTQQDESIFHEYAEHWYTDLKTWERFCQTCTQLTRVDWSCWPFATAYFEAFGRVTKPKLTKLVLFARSGDGGLLRDVGKEDAQIIQATRYGRTATNVEAVLPACPNLESLYIGWRSPRDTGEMACDLSVFGAEFFATLAVVCPRVDTLWFSEPEEPKSYSTWSRKQPPKPMCASIGDEALTHIAQLRHLGQLKIKGASVGGRGLANLVLAPAPFAESPRSFQISIGIPSADGDRGFYDTLHGLLEGLVTRESSASRACMAVSLRLTNKMLDEVDKQWSRTYWKVIKKLADRVRAKHPRLTVRVLMNGYDGSGFKRIRELLLHTAGTAAGAFEWKGKRQYGDAAEDTAVDPVFTNRTFLRYFPDEAYGEHGYEERRYVDLQRRRVLRRV